MEDRVAHREAGDKARVRAEFSARLATLSRAERARESVDLVRRLLRWAETAEERVLMGTLPLDGEPDLLPLYDWWLSDGRDLVLARTGAARSLQFHGVESLAV